MNGPPSDYLSHLTEVLRQPGNFAILVIFMVTTVFVVGMVLLAALLIKRSYSYRQENGHTRTMISSKSND